MKQLVLTTLVVRDYDEAIAFFTDVVGLRLREDTDMGAGKRWVVVGPDEGAGLLLAKAGNEMQATRVGDQTGGRVGFFLHTDTFAEDYARMQAAQVRFVDQPRDEVYGRVVVFFDLYGNRWDLIEPRRHA
ncbi:glyoxalase family protein [alpha proteobacterium U9-1i]|nr:glyoxalase family protein [alpha proteobacterium U9-1i]